MAVFWLDPFAVSNGDGSYASPFSLTTSTRINFNEGDELRLKAFYRSDILQATVYSGTQGADCQSIQGITGGGGYTDFAVNDVIYIQEYDAYAVLQYVEATNSGQLRWQYFGALPIVSTELGQTVTFQKVDPAYLATSITVSNLYVTQTLAGRTVTDGWVSETLRVTDGSAVTLICSNATSYNRLYIENTVLAYSVAETINPGTADLSNTVLLPSRGSTGATYGQLYSRSHYTTVHLKQITSNSTAAAMYIGNNSSASPSKSPTITVDLLNAYAAITTSYSYEATATFGRIVTYNDNNMNGAFNYGRNLSFTVNKAVLYTVGGNALPTPAQALGECTFHIEEGVEYKANVSIYGISQSYGDLTVTVGAGFTAYKTDKTIQITSVDAEVYNVASGAFSYRDALFKPVPSLPGVTVTNPGKMRLNNKFVGNSSKDGVLLTAKATYVVPGAYLPLVNASASTLYPSDAELLFHTADGSSAPVNYLGVQDMPRNSASALIQFCEVTLDDVEYKTAAPSLSFYLASKFSYFTKEHPHRKTIKLPVVQGVPIVVSGSLKTNVTSVADGDIKVFITADGNTKAVEHQMTTAALNAWEDFSIGFTPAFTGEAHFVIDLYFPAAGNVWLSDLEVS